MINQKNKVSKTDRVLRHLQNEGSITSWEAINNYGVTRLSASIHTLRKKYDISSEPETCTDRYGNEAHFVRYVYHGVM